VDDHDEFVRLRAELDQQREGLREVAGNLWVFYNELAAQGFAPSQALAITQTFLSSGIGSVGGDDE